MYSTDVYSKELQYTFTMKNGWREDLPLSHSPARLFAFSSAPYLVPAMIGLVAISIAAILNAGIPYVFKLITNAATELSRGGSYDDLLTAAWMYVGITFVSECMWRISGFAGSYWATGARLTARHALTAYVTHHSREYFSNRFAGSLANKISHAANGMKDLVEFILWKIGEFIISMIASLSIAFYVSPIIGGIFLTWVLIVAAYNAYFGMKRIALAGSAQALETRLNGSTVDMLNNISAVQEFGRKDFEHQRLADLSVERRVVGLRNWHFGERILTANSIVQSVFGAVMVFVAINLARMGLISVGDIVFVMTMIFRTRDHMMFIGSHLHHVGELWGEIQDSLEEIIEPHDIVDMSGATPLSVTEGEISFEGVTFGYGKEENEVIRNFTLDISTRQKVGVVGRSGAGKSTLIKLLLRHYEVSKGSITIDGQSIATVTQDSLRKSIAVVPQEPLLFHRSLRENIAYGDPNASDGSINDAASRAHADVFIAKLPHGYDTLVGERGVKLSGGERQRIAIARAILKDAPILILDEATSALDSESEVAIQKALHKLMEGKTVIAIAHRLSTLREMDRIIVMEEGRIIEDGTHAELLVKRGIYSELWNHQAGGFILDEEEEA